MFSMPPNPLGYKKGAVCPVGCRDNDISINWFIEGAEIVVVSDVVDPVDKSLIITGIECWNCRLTSNEVVDALEKGGDN